MKLNTIVQLALVIGLGSTSLQARSHRAVYSPDRGVICDRKSGFCADKYGISLGLTKEFLGQGAQNKWTRRIKGNFDVTVFAMSNGLYCDTKKKICKSSKWDNRPNRHWTRTLFGRNIASSGRGKSSESMQDMQRDCKTFISGKVDLPMAAIRVYPGHGRNGRYSLPVSVQWDEPFVDERGICRVSHGKAVNYRVTN